MIADQVPKLIGDQFNQPSNVHEKRDQNAYHYTNETISLSKISQWELDRYEILETKVLVSKCVWHEDKKLKPSSCCCQKNFDFGKVEAFWALAITNLTFCTVWQQLQINVQMTKKWTVMIITYGKQQSCKAVCNFYKYLSSITPEWPTLITDLWLCSTSFSRLFHRRFCNCTNRN